MPDFLEYMRTLQVWQQADTHLNKQFLPVAHVSSSQLESLPSPQEIPAYTKDLFRQPHPWLLSFANAQFSRTHIQTWLKQRYLLSWCFPNWLIAVTSKLLTPQTRIPLLMNLSEEHGLVKDKGHSKPHPEMWQQLFEELKIVVPGTPLPLPTSAAELLPGTQLYLQIYTSACFGYPVSYGLGTLAFTEAILSYENKLILEGLGKLGVSLQGQEFFALHSNCDEAHADEIIGVITQIADRPETVWEVWQGVEMAVRARKAFYDTLLDRTKIPVGLQR